MRLIASPAAFRWILSAQPVLQKPQTDVVVAAGISRAGTRPSPKSAGCSTMSAVIGPVRARSSSSSVELIAGDARHFRRVDRAEKKIAFGQLAEQESARATTRHRRVRSNCNHERKEDAAQQRSSDAELVDRAKRTREQQGSLAGRRERPGRR